MNKIRLSAYMMAFMAAGFSGCTNDVEMPVDSKGTQTVIMTVDVSRSADDTRSSLSQVDDDLACVWTEDDKLLVTSTDGSRLGVLTIKSINSEDRSKATFSGKLENVADGKNVTVNYIYLGNKGDYTTVPTKNVYAADYSEQDGTIKSLSDHDIMTKQAQAIIENGCSYVDGLVMERRVSFARFKLNLPDGVTFDQNSTVTVSGDGVNNALSFNGGTLESAYTAGTVTITPGKNDFYMTLLPNTLSSGFDLTFTVSTTDAAYTGVYQVSKTIAQGKFYRKDNSGNPIEVTDWNEIVIPIDYENLGNWGLPSSSPAYTDSGLRQPTKDSGEVGWVYNQRLQLIKDCWFDPITFTKNGGVNGYLYSTRRAEPSYYQWGRWLGFPLEIGVSPIFDYAGQSSGLDRLENPYSYAWVNNSYPICIDPNWNPTSSRFGYTVENFLPTYVRIYTHLWSNWTVQKSIYAASVWGMDNTRLNANIALDYIVGGYKTTAKWEDRSGNPCPDGYRIPTKSELQSLVPSKTSGFSKHAEVKTAKSGKKYAMCWEVINIDVPSNFVNNVGVISNRYNLTNNITSKNTVPAVKITSVPVADDIEVTPESVIFSDENAKTLVIGAYGNLAANGAINFFGQRAVIWGSESQEYGSGITGYAGVALEIRFSNNQISYFSVRSKDRAEGINIIPVRDKKAKGSTLKPYWPYCMIGLE